MSEEQKGTWALLIANHGRTYLVCVRVDETWKTDLPATGIKTIDALEVWSSLMPAPDGGLAKGTFNTMFEQCGHAAPVTFFAPSAFVWLNDLHEDDRAMYEKYIQQNEKDRLGMRAQRAGLSIAGEKPREGR